MTTYRVDCHTPDNADLDRRLQGLGGTTPSSWWFTIDTIISMIDQGHIFYTMVDNEVALVIVETNPTSGRRFVKTMADSFLRNNLLSLPYCP